MLPRRVMRSVLALSALRFGDADTTPGTRYVPALAALRSGNVRRILALATLLFAGACFPQTIQTDRGPRGIPMGPPGWNLEIREHVDLWLHGYAMLSPYESTLPFFRRGYREEMAAVRARGNTFTLLDANADRLAPHLTSNPSLVNGQFAPMYFPSWAELRDGIDALLRVNGNVSRAGGGERRAVAILQRMFPTAEDREWLRTFAISLDDERTKFYDAYWQDRQRSAMPAFTAADAALRAATGGPLLRYMTNANLRRGTVLMSLPLGGEGRSVLEGVERSHIAVPRPVDADSGEAVVFVFAHELVGPAVGTASREFTGELPRGLSAEAYETSSLVRAGHHLLQRADPELAVRYARYYVGLAGRDPGADPEAALAAVFPLPSALQSAVFAQVDEVWEGI